jgi:hypothetical protein
MPALKGAALKRRSTKTFRCVGWLLAWRTWARVRFVWV